MIVRIRLPPKVPTPTASVRSTTINLSRRRVAPVANTAAKAATGRARSGLRRKDATIPTRLLTSPSAAVAVARLTSCAIAKHPPTAIAHPNTPGCRKGPCIDLSSPLTKKPSSSALGSSISRIAPGGSISNTAPTDSKTGGEIKPTRTSRTASCSVQSTVSASRKKTGNFRARTVPSNATVRGT